MAFRQLESRSRKVHPHKIRPLSHYYTLFTKVQRQDTLDEVNMLKEHDGMNCSLADQAEEPRGDTDLMDFYNLLRLYNHLTTTNQSGNFHKQLNGTMFSGYSSVHGLLRNCTTYTDGMSHAFMTKSSQYKI